MNWWLARLPLEQSGEDETTQITPCNNSPTLNSSPACAGSTPGGMLLRARHTRIYFLRRFFAYPISPCLDSIKKLGFSRTTRIALSYARAAMRPIRPEKTLEEFFINRFGRELYCTFFKAYTEKVWGVPCSQINAEWGAQRIKGLSIRKAISHSIQKSFGRNRGANSSSIAQKETETSLIERFLYPRFGPGQMWETVAGEVEARGGKIKMQSRVLRIQAEGKRIHAIETTIHAGEKEILEGDYFFSTMPVRELMNALDPAPPEELLTISDGLIYRDFLTVGLLLNKLCVKEKNQTCEKLIRDTWLYIQEPGVHVGRMQIFNNWSPSLVADPQKVWVGLEYFCNEGDEIWTLSDEKMIALAIEEMHSIGLIDRTDALDATVIRMPKSYPAYFGTYNRFDEIRNYLDGFENLFLIGRNGMHKYNNQDHSMLTAMTAVDNIIAGRIDKSNIWAVNTEFEYHEENGARR